MTEPIENKRDARIDKMYNLDNYPIHLRKIVEVILADGELLSDGVVYYASYDDILEFAQDIYDVTRK